MRLQACRASSRSWTYCWCMWKSAIVSKGRNLQAKMWSKKSRWPKEVKARSIHLATAQLDGYIAMAAKTVSSLGANAPRNPTLFLHITHPFCHGTQSNGQRLAQYLRSECLQGAQVITSMVSRSRALGAIPSFSWLQKNRDPFLRPTYTSLRLGPWPHLQVGLFQRAATTFGN